MDGLPVVGLSVDGEKSKINRMANSMHTTYKVTINTQTFLNMHVFLINTPN